MTQNGRDAEARQSIAALRRSHDELAALVGGLDAGDLDKQSGSSEWTVADVLSHLGSGAEIGYNTLATGKNDQAGAPAIWDRWNAMSPSEKATNFVSWERRLVEALEALSDEDLATRKFDLGFVPQPVDVVFFAGLRLSEVGQHRWDVEVAFDPAATVAAYVVPFVLAQLPLFAGWFAKPTGATGRVAVTTVDPAGTYTLDVRKDGASLTDGTTADADTHLSLPGEAFMRLTGGRLAADHTPASLRIDGELSLDDLRRLFPGY
ncbi:MAG TPA: maleylpyruvate isomerase N-terminal domain-containing protein [Acidimicrobiales bacterium]|jgi:uncharacterized protein (TIGR03083 family)|nr:maleylpyruvate isomerase N-terminal domain-containing protein [Acidimicrobiales bacterium]